MNKILYCPVPHTYVVAELNIQATVQNLDAQAQEASQSIKPAKCILYLYDVRDVVATRWLRPTALITHLRLPDFPSPVYPRRSRRILWAQASAQKAQRTA